MSTSPLPAVAAAAAAMFTVGTLAAISAVIQGYPLYGGQALRYGAAAVILLVIAAAGRQPRPRLTSRDRMFVVALAAVGLVLFNVCVVEATRYANPAVVGTIIGSVPIALAIAGPLLTGATDGRRRPSPRVVTAAVIIVVGASVTTGLGSGSLRGVLLALGALTCEVGFSLLAMPILPKLGPIRVSAYSVATATPLLLLVGALVDGRDLVRTPTAAELAGLAYLAAVVSVGAFLLWYFALPRLGPDRAGLLAGFAPVGAIVTTVVLGLGSPTAADLAGSALVIGGIAIGVGRERPRVSAAVVAPAAAPT